MRLKNFLLMLLAAPLLSACFQAALMLAEGGIGGTGISTGVITAFGSVFVNGVEYDTGTATFTRDGMPVYRDRTEYHVGEYVTVKGKVNPDGVTGTATELVFNNVLEGPVTTVSADGVSLEIMGQTVRTNALTVFHGFTILTDLTAGKIVEVSGVRGANGDITASSLTSTTNPNLEIYGTALNVNISNQTFKIGNLTVNYTGALLSAGVPSNGQYLEVKSTQALQAGVLMASEVTLQEQYQHFSEGTEVEIEGMITYFNSATNFTVNGQSITTNVQTQFEDGTVNDLSVDALVEVDGTVNAQGVLVADEVSIKQSASQPIIEREGTVSSVDVGANTFVLAGDQNETVAINSATLWLDEREASGSFALDISQLYGVKVELKAKRSNGRLLALRVKLEDASDE
ncbi:MAG: DUF5666 domain-containing protein [Thiothrix sp.]|uniref:DUF5666 domain-containing protein n=1 Tax=Thiothrix sp. TaxID=1032 RepID=UPI0026253598|nr:DUF5666 domain-containing protein [Thiothrix sp.]MDD5393948.1 DUF5666 domain-containing protein [Thiothrix sp.]